MKIYLLTFILINLIIYLKKDFFISRYNIYDLPDKNRKQHHVQISVFGGAIILINLFVLLVLIFVLDLKFPEFVNNNRNLFSIFFISTMVFLIGLSDDKLLINNISKFISLLILIFLSVLVDNDIIIENIKFSFMSREILLLNFSLIFTVLCILSFMNAYNFLDGIDLLCGTYAFIIFLIFFILTKSLFFIPLIFSLIVFCILNYKKKLFLGDSGALLISFLISIFMIKIYKLNLIYVEQIIIILLLPVLDNLRVFYIRFMNKVNILTPDNNHLHHLLIKKYKLITTNIIILSLIFFPYFLTSFGLDFYFMIFTQLAIYFFIIIKFKKDIN